MQSRSFTVLELNFLTQRDTEKRKNNLLLLFFRYFDLPLLMGIMDFSFRPTIILLLLTN